MWLEAENGQIFNINNQVAEGVGSSPLVVFEFVRSSTYIRDACRDSWCNDAVGVFQVIGPMTRVSDAEARDCAAMFFRNFSNQANLQNLCMR